MTSGSCPFCDAEYRPFSSRPQDHCHFVGEFAEKLKGLRSPYCYERQISGLEERCQSLAAHAVLDEARIEALQSQNSILTQKLQEQKKELEAIRDIVLDARELLNDGDFEYESATEKGKFFLGCLCDAESLREALIAYDQLIETENNTHYFINTGIICNNCHSFLMADAKGRTQCGCYPEFDNEET